MLIIGETGAGYMRSLSLYYLPNFSVYLKCSKKRLFKKMLSG